ncbi:amidohydrolase family protein [Streptomyces sp. NPDC048187]|uniref:amidohydrolase family protein n=1 Tax=Streptomyces sp. NPDC048187 TaxID=3365509 RepID=UPI003719C776
MKPPARDRIDVHAHLQVTDADHVLFGSDWPAAPEATVAGAIGNLVDFEGFNAEESAGVDRGNAARFFPRFARARGTAPVPRIRNTPWRGTSLAKGTQHS